MAFRCSQLVGRFKLVVDDELLGFIERTFVERAPEHQRQGVRGEALAEAEAAEIEFTAEGTFISRAGSQEFFRVALVFDHVEHEQLSFEKFPGQRVTVTLLADGGVLALQPERPPARFRRV